MPNQKDIDAMSEDIRELIDEETKSVRIKHLSDSQPNYNPLMKEIVGVILYDIVTTKAIVKDSPGQDLSTEVAGDKYNETRIIRIPHKIEVNNVLVDITIHNLDIIEFVDEENHEWRILSIKELIGEKLVKIKKVK